MNLSVNMLLITNWKLSPLEVKWHPKVTQLECI